MIRTILSTLAMVLTMIMATTATADTVPGGAATSCTDPNAFTPVMSADGTRVLYWNNPTCAAASGATDGTPAANPRGPFSDPAES